MALVIGSAVCPRVQAAGSVSLGMTRNKVLETLGEPVGTLRECGEELLIYKTLDIYIVSNRVVRVHEISGTLSPTTAPKPVGTSRSAPVVEKRVFTDAVEMPPTKSRESSFAKLFGEQAANFRGCQFTTGRRALFIGGLILCGAGLLTVTGGSIWLLVRAFVVHIGWGLACLFLPLAQIVFLCCHWSVGRKPFVVSLGGTAGALLGGYLAIGLGLMPALAASSAKSQPAAILQAGSLANDILIRDAMPAVSAHVAGLGCNSPEKIKHIQVLRQPEGPTGGKRWQERWFITGCGKEFPVDLVFRQDGHGGAFYEIHNPK